MSDTQAAYLTRLYRGWGEQAFSPKALASAKLGMLDIIGCIVGGAPTPTAALVRDLAREMGGPGSASVIGTAERLPPPLAALANGVAGHVLDYDDMNSTLIGHPSVVLVPAILSLAEGRGKSGLEILSAYILGLEVNGHFGRMMEPGHYAAGWHATSSLGIFGATAAAAAILDLDADAALNALSMAASNSAGIRANFGTMTKSLHAGQAAEGAVRAACLSARGFTANPGVFDGAVGYFSAYGRNSGAVPGPAGSALEIEAVGLGIKPYACCGAGVSVIDAALDLRAEHGLGQAGIAGIEVVLTPQAADIMPFHDAVDSLQAKYSLAYCAAVALLDGRGGLAQFDDPRVLRADVQDLVKRTRVETDSKMAWGGGRFGVDLKVTLIDGRQFSTQVDVPRGHPSRMLEADRQLDKFLECAAPTLGEERAREVARQIDRLEAAPDAQALMNLLRA